MRFRDIPQYTRCASYRVNSRWHYAIETLDRWQLERFCPLDINPDFQRAHVWTQDQQSAYVEFKLRGGFGSNQIHFNCPGWQSHYKGPFVLVDGKQRIEAVRAFIRDELSVLGGMFYSDFSDKLLNDVDFVFCVNNLNTRAQVLQWYLDLNTGGVVHSDEEITKVRLLLRKELYPETGDE